jgi:hypothetical protein
VKPKDEECFEGAETEREASESVTPIPEEIKTENPDDPIMTTDEYGDGIGIVEGPLSSEAASFPLYPQPPRTPPPAWMQQQRRTRNETTTDSQMPFAMQLCIILVFVENMSDSRRDRKRGHTFDMGSVR